VRGGDGGNGGPSSSLGRGNWEQEKEMVVYLAIVCRDEVDIKDSF
jgi:hypothetical protein